MALQVWVGIAHRVGGTVAGLIERGRSKEGIPRQSEVGARRREGPRGGRVRVSFLCS